MAIVYFMIGSNEGDREHSIATAREFIAERIGEVQAQSSLYESEPWGFSSPQNFLNMAVQVETALSPAALLMEISYIENNLGRIRKPIAARYESRTVDIDIIFYDHVFMVTPELVIPHKHLHERLFVLKPLCDIAPHYVHPLLLENVESLAAKCADSCKVWRYEGVCQN